MTTAKPARLLLITLAALSLAIAAEVAYPEDAFRQLVKAFSDSGPQKIELQDSANSPDGTWVAERYMEYYSEDTAIQIALHHPFKSSANEALNFPHKISLSYIPFKWVGDDALFKWLDNSTLLIAALEGNNQSTKPDGEFSEGTRPIEFNGVNLRYGLYTPDPDKSRIAGSQKIFSKNVNFNYRFEKDDGVGVPGVDCYLYMSVPDGDYFDHLLLKIEAYKTFEIKVLLQDPKNGYKIDPKHPYRIDPERAGAAVNISTYKEAKKSPGHPTGAKVENFSPIDDSPLMVREFREIMAPNGSPAPMWGLVYSLHGQSNLQTIISKIKSGNFHVKIGFWLDNAEVIYSSTVPNDQSAIIAFEKCVDQNHIFTNHIPDSRAN